MRIMTVCLGNICRSPAAEAVLIRKLKEAGLDDVEVTSAGTGPWHVGNRPHRMSIAEGERRGYSFATVGIQFDAPHFDDADLILAMDVDNERDLRELARTPQDADKVVRLGASASDVDGGAQDVPDPYGGPEEGFTSMYDQIEDAVDGLVRALQEETVGEIVVQHRAR